jgi:cation:H+ antiporter
MSHVFGFLVCAIVIFLAGRSLSYYGDLLAEKTGMGKAWIGLILMASVTSLPELMVGISSSALLQSADLAVGDILGSCAFNLGILALMDVFVPNGHSLLGTASRSQVVAASLGIILMSMAGLAIFLPTSIVIIPWVGLISILFIVVYLVSVRLIYLNEKNPENGDNQLSSQRHDLKAVTLRFIITRYVFFALIIIVSALALPYFADHIAEDTGLGRSFVGTFFLAISTSLPEIAVSLAAVRMGSIDLAVGNLLGSNLFNILILAMDDILYTKGHILKDASVYNLISVFSAILMTSVVVIGLSFRVKGKQYLLAWDAMLVGIIYVINLFLLYMFTN